MGKKTGKYRNVISYEEFNPNEYLAMKHVKTKIHAYIGKLSKNDIENALKVEYKEHKLYAVPFLAETVSLSSNMVDAIVEDYYEKIGKSPDEYLNSEKSIAYFDAFFHPAEKLNADAKPNMSEEDIYKRVTFSLPDPKRYGLNETAILKDYEQMYPKEFLLSLYGAFHVTAYENNWKDLKGFDKKPDGLKDKAFIQGAKYLLAMKWYFDISEKAGITVQKEYKDKLEKALDEFLPENDLRTKVLLKEVKLKSFTPEEVEKVSLEQSYEWRELTFREANRDIKELSKELSEEQKLRLKEITDSLISRYVRSTVNAHCTINDRMTDLDAIRYSPIVARLASAFLQTNERIREMREKLEEQASVDKDKYIPAEEHNEYKRQAEKEKRALSDSAKSLSKELKLTQGMLAEEKDKAKIALSKLKSLEEKAQKAADAESKLEKTTEEQYIVNRELALLRQENAKLKRQIALRDKLNIAPETKEMLDKIENYCNTVSREDKIKFLKDKSIILVGGDKSNIASALKNAGITSVDEKYDDGKIKGKYDIYVCLIKKMSHSQDDQTTKAAKTNNAVLLYFDYMNADRLIDEMYEAYMNKLDQ